MYQLCSKKSLCFVAACWFTQSLSLSLSFIYPGFMAREVREQRIKTNGIWLNVVEKGDNGGPLVLLLHGFPETWFSWRHQIDFLSSHGYHVVAPDLRGYADSDSPPSHESYTVSHLVADVIGLRAAAQPRAMAASRSSTSTSSTDCSTGNLTSQVIAIPRSMFMRTRTHRVRHHCDPRAPPLACWQHSTATVPVSWTHDIVCIFRRCLFA